MLLSFWKAPPSASLARKMVLFLTSDVSKARGEQSRVQGDTSNQPAGKRRTETLRNDLLLPLTPGSSNHPPALSVELFVQLAAWGRGSLTELS
jgi:hypothetical protein